MKINLYKDYYITSSAGDFCFTLKTIKVQKNKDSKLYGEEVETIINYPQTIESAVRTICEKEVINSKATTLEGLIKEERVLQNMVTELGKHIGVDSILKHIIRHTEDFLIKGDSPTEEPKKRGRKKKE